MMQVNVYWRKEKEVLCCNVYLRKGNSMAPIIATLIFVAMFLLIISDKIPRHIVTLTSGLLTLVLVFGLCMHSGEAIKEALSFHSIINPGFWYHTGEATTSAGINWETIFFVCGMMIMVEGMADSGFFRWLCMTLARMVHYQVIPIFMIFMVVSAALSMFIDSITVILFLAAVTVELAHLLKFDPIPVILAEIFCANLGGSATMCGDPPNIIIGTSLGYSFGDFIANTGIIALIAFFATVPYFYFCFRKQLSVAEARDTIVCPDPREAIKSKKSFTVSCLIFACAVALLVTHAQTGLTVACIGTLVGIVTLVSSGNRAKKLLKQVDWNTLLFFIGLFVVISGLEQTGVLEILAKAIGKASGGNVVAIIAIILWGSAVASAFVDNIPFAATMIPVIRSLSAAEGIDLDVLAWTLSMGTDIGGNATPIGASANVVGTSIAAKNGHPISWGRYCRSMAPATVLVVMISMIVLIGRYV